MDIKALRNLYKNFFTKMKTSHVRNLPDHVLQLTVSNITAGVTEASCTHSALLRSGCVSPRRVPGRLHSPMWRLLHSKTAAGVRGTAVPARPLAHDTDAGDGAGSAAPGQAGPESGKPGREHDVKQRILTASLQFVRTHGWTRHALSAGAESVGYPGVAHGLFPGEGAELVQYFCTSCNSQLARKLEEQTEQDGYTRKDTQFVRDAVETRLRMIIPYLERWPQALAIQAMPANIPQSLASLLTLVDDICYYAGDRSTDFNWYSRRVGLAGLYKVTELHLVQDTSEDYSATWHFLSRRLDDVAHLRGYVRRSGEVSEVARETAAAAFVTARNILGLNIGNR